MDWNLISFVTDICMYIYIYIIFMFFYDYSNKLVKNKIFIFTPNEVEWRFDTLLTMFLIRTDILVWALWEITMLWKYKSYVCREKQVKE